MFMGERGEGTGGEYFKYINRFWQKILFWWHWILLQILYVLIPKLCFPVEEAGH